MVVNLAAGLDTRPYRMALPGSLAWVEVDLPEILDYKESILRDETPTCKLERVRLDLADGIARSKLFDWLGGRAENVLILSEGLIIYLTREEAGALADDLRRPQSFQHWLLDIASPGLLRVIQKATSPQFADGVTALKFAPEDGPQFFARHGWKPVEVRSMLKTAAHLKRLSLLLLRLAALLPENPAKMGSRPWSGVCLLNKIQA